MVLRVFVFALMVMVGFGCRKPKEPAEPGVPDLPVGVSMMAGNVKWTATSYSARAFSQPNISGSGRDSVLQIVSYDSVNNQILYFDIDGWDGKIGDFISPRGTKSYFVVFSYVVDENNPSAQYNHISCKIKLTKISDNNIQGIFDAAMVHYAFGDTLSITNGTFNVPFKH